ncbi:GmrSD restriction endonuclease domain-containing protein [Acinetobacter baumannii]
MTNESIQALKVQALFESKQTYIIPMYQRNYAWGEKEIDQLILDIQDYQKQPEQLNQGQTQGSKKYYIGTLVVFERSDGTYEIIDGQQRFTTLTLLAICLKRLSKEEKVVLDMSWFNQFNLDFESRPKSSLTFQALLRGDHLQHLKSSEYNADLVQGFELLQRAIEKIINQGGLSVFCKYLFENVVITQVLVPKDTDLNHYFEVMNNRGEQLEKHEILKARLMSVLNQIKDEADKTSSMTLFTSIWNATANMERYVQYGFSTIYRDVIFGKDWGDFVPENASSLLEIFSKNVESQEQPSSKSNFPSISEMLKKVPKRIENKNTKEEKPERFNSIINFPNFLLQVLQIWLSQTNHNEKVALDDKQLIDQFEKYILLKGQGNQEHERVVENVKGFMFTLLKCKFIFDQYIVKRDYSTDHDDWSIKRLKRYKDSSSYVNTLDGDSSEITQKILLLMTAFHVSTPTLSYKYWLNGVLYWLYQNTDKFESDYFNALQHLARKFIFQRYLNEKQIDYFDLIYGNQTIDDFKIDQSKLSFGNIENNFVFNYLDFLIYCDAENSNDKVIKNFKFTQRSSVEHFYAQQIEGERDKLDHENLHRFGNLCLISSSKNSSIGNRLPSAKRDYFMPEIRKGKIDTLKLYLMIQTLEEEKVWKKEQILDHEKKMLDLFELDYQDFVK